MIAINNPNYLKYMMSFDANGARTGTVQRTTSIQPVASNIELRTIASSQVLPHPPATPLCGPLSRVSSNRCYLRRCCSTTYSPTTPRLTRIIQTVRNIYSMAMEVTLGTGMSCISSVCRGEDNGSDNEDNLDDRQQRPNSSSPKCAMREKTNPDGPTSTFLHPDIEPSAQRLIAQGAKHWPDGSPGGEGAGAVRGVGPSEAVSNRPERRAGGRLTPEIVHPVTKRAIVTTEK